MDLSNVTSWCWAVVVAVDDVGVTSEQTAVAVAGGKPEVEGCGSVVVVPGRGALPLPFLSVECAPFIV